MVTVPRARRIYRGESKWESAQIPSSLRGVPEARLRGHIEERPNGTFRASVFAGRDLLTGRKRYLKQTHPTRKLAERALTKMQNDVDEQRHPRTSITLTQAIEQWLGVVRHEASTRERNDQLIRLYIKPVLGGLQLAQVDAETLERFYARLLGCRRLCDPRKPSCKQCEPLAPNTVRKVHFVVRAALDRAVRYGYIVVNGAALADPSGFRRSEPDPPTPAEAQALLNEAARDPEWALLLSLTMTVGWRRGEICALRWSDVDLADGTLTIERSQWGRLEKTTKTNQQRKVAIGPDAVERLAAHRERCADACAELGLKLGPNAYVFSPAPDRCTPLLPHSVSRDTDEWPKLPACAALASTPFGTTPPANWCRRVWTFARSPGALVTAAAGRPPCARTPPGVRRLIAGQPSRSRGSCQLRILQSANREPHTSFWLPGWRLTSRTALSGRAPSFRSSPTWPPHTTWPRTLQLGRWRC